MRLLTTAVLLFCVVEILARGYLGRPKTPLKKPNYHKDLPGKSMKKTVSSWEPRQSHRNRWGVERNVPLPEIVDVLDLPTDYSGGSRRAHIAAKISHDTIKSGGPAVPHMAIGRSSVSPGHIAVKQGIIDPFDVTEHASVNSGFVESGLGVGVIKPKKAYPTKKTTPSKKYLGDPILGTPGHMAVKSGEVDPFGSLTSTGTFGNLDSIGEHVAAKSGVGLVDSSLGVGVVKPKMLYPSKKSYPPKKLGHQIDPLNPVGSGLVDPFVDPLSVVPAVDSVGAHIAAKSGVGLVDSSLGVGVVKPKLSYPSKKSYPPKKKLGSQIDPLNPIGSGLVDPFVDPLSVVPAVDSVGAHIAAKSGVGLVDSSLGVGVVKPKLSYPSKKSYPPKKKLGSQIDPLNPIGSGLVDPFVDPLSVVPVVDSVGAHIAAKSGVGLVDSSLGVGVVKPKMSYPSKKSYPPKKKLGSQIDPLNPIGSGLVDPFVDPLSVVPAVDSVGAHIAAKSGVGLVDSSLGVGVVKPKMSYPSKKSYPPKKKLGSQIDPLNPIGSGLVDPFLDPLSVVPAVDSVGAHIAAKSGVGLVDSSLGVGVVNPKLSYPSKKLYPPKKQLGSQIDPLNPIGSGLVDPFVDPLPVVPAVDSVGAHIAAKSGVGLVDSSLGVGVVKPKVSYPSKKSYPPKKKLGSQIDPLNPIGSGLVDPFVDPLSVVPAVDSVGAHIAAKSGVGLVDSSLGVGVVKPKLSYPSKKSYPPKKKLGSQIDPLNPIGSGLVDPFVDPLSVVPAVDSVGAHIAAKSGVGLVDSSLGVGVVKPKMSYPSKKSYPPKKKLGSQIDPLNPIGSGLVDPFLDPLSVVPAVDSVGAHIAAKSGVGLVDSSLGVGVVNPKLSYPSKKLYPPKKQLGSQIDPLNPIGSGLVDPFVDPLPVVPAVDSVGAHIAAKSGVGLVDSSLGVGVVKPKVSYPSKKSYPPKKKLGSQIDPLNPIGSGLVDPFVDPLSVVPAVDSVGAHIAAKSGVGLVDSSLGVGVVKPKLSYPSKKSYPPKKKLGSQIDPLNPIGSGLVDPFVDPLSVVPAVDSVGAHIAAKSGVGLVDSSLGVGVVNPKMSYPSKKSYPPKKKLGSQIDPLNPIGSGLVDPFVDPLSVVPAVDSVGAHIAANSGVGLVESSVGTTVLKPKKGYPKKNSYPSTKPLGHTIHGTGVADGGLDHFEGIGSRRLVHSPLAAHAAAKSGLAGDAGLSMGAIKSKNKYPHKKAYSARKVLRRGHFGRVRPRIRFHKPVFYKRNNGYQRRTFIRRGRSRFARRRNFDGF